MYPMKYKYCHFNRKHTIVCHKLCKAEAVNTTIFILKTNNVFIINIVILTATLLVHGK